MTEQLLSEFKQGIGDVRLMPSSGGRFEVTIDGKLVFSKAKEGRFPEPDEIRGPLATKVAPQSGH